MNKPNDYSGLQLVGAIRKLQSKDTTIGNYEAQIDFYRDEIEAKDAEIARLKSNEKKAFWCGFERAIMTPDDLHILNHWNGYLEIQSAINPIGDK